MRTAPHNNELGVTLTLSGAAESVVRRVVTLDEIVTGALEHPVETS